jgi:hypothetical protein
MISATIGVSRFSAVTIAAVRMTTILASSR